MSQCPSRLTAPGSSSEGPGASLEQRLAAAEARCAEMMDTADDAVKFLGRLAEVTWNAGYPGGDRDQTMRNLVALVAERDRLAKALKPFTLPESYVTDEEECRKNAEMDWCAVHSFRWPCPVGPARAALAGQVKL